MGYFDDFADAASRAISPNACLLCRDIPEPDELTEEHVFPKWLQRRHNLWNHTLDLQNRMRVRYRSLKVPACKTCNGRHLGKLEELVSTATSNGYDSFAQLPSSVIAMWSAKLLLGILVKETTMKWSFKDSTNFAIMSSEEMERFQALHITLNQCRFDTTGIEHSSVITKRAKVPKRTEEQFDFVDCIAFGPPGKVSQTAAIAFRIGDCCAFVHFLEYGLHAVDYGNDFHTLLPAELHPLQFREAAAIFMYKCSLLRMNVRMSLGVSNAKFIQFIQTESINEDETFFNEWDSKQYASLLSYYTGLPLDDIILPDGKVRSLLIDDRGKSLDMPL